MNCRLSPHFIDTDIRDTLTSVLYALNISPVSLGNESIRYLRPLFSFISHHKMLRSHCLLDNSSEWTNLQNGSHVPNIIRQAFHVCAEPLSAHHWLHLVLCTNIFSLFSTVLSPRKMRKCTAKKIVSMIYYNGQNTFYNIYKSLHY